MSIRSQLRPNTDTPKHVKCIAKVVCSVATVMLSTPFFTLAHADEPGRGQTAQFERNYLTNIINHHYSALRITELAAGTDQQRDAALNNPQEGTAPTPGTSPTPAKASSDEIKSMARQANRMQREEIKTAQRFLQEWYGQQHTPTLTQEGQQQIQRLEQTAAGNQFDRAYLEVFSNHHYGALHPSLDCEVKVDIRHEPLKNYCHGIVEHQKIEINNMREQLCKRFNVCDFQPSASNRE
ncbi:DUF305 family protein family protein [Paucimonas lemoignei]|uniref:DUF305 family protein family protein n=1 Tax=Paucimonas lemoignei TaxID=29443 RepID=A0A4R3HP67_PAULE|nr:DUF305 domain-containing protein [Paucimonas lemoignei]TCS33092.1 DUF305 family protein family protein [Paucimonas lemoignei]